ncbi:MAG: caspase family protein, partial [Pseudomonadota bacterium]
MRLVCALVAMLGLLAAHAAEAAQPRKLALVIGNDLYSNFVPLERAVADSRAYRDMLSQTRGFEVFYTENADRAATFQLVFQFISNIRPGDTAMVVYSGHGVQLDPDRRDSLFLLPIDIPNVDPGLGAEEAFLSANGIRFSDISGWVKERGAKLSIFVLDACRNNPFTNRSGTRSVGLSRGLGRVDASEGEFVFFAAAPGEVALDRLPHNDDNPNSVFTRSFLKHFKPNTYLEDVANNVQEEVLELSRLANYRQAPYYTDGVAGKACLDDSCSVVAPLAEVAAEPAPEPATALNADVEETFWRLCETRDNPAYCEAYIQQYPEGPRALLAQVRLAEIRASEQLASRTPAVRADPSAKPAEEERRRAAEAETLAAEIEARRRAEAEAAQLREERAAKIERLEQELAARRDAEAEAARLLAEIEARRQAEEEAKTAALAASATVPQPELASATTPGFVPAPEPAEPAAPIATGDEGDKGLVIAALPTNRVEPP